MAGIMQSMVGASFGSSSEPLSLTFYESRFGANMGIINVYVVDTSGNIQGSAVYSASGNTFTPLWSLKTAATPDVSGDFRIAWHYRSGTGLRGDYAIDTVSVQGNSYNFDASNDSFVCSTTNTSSSTTALSGSASVATSTTRGRWNRHSGETGSSNTGPNSAQSGSFYLYSETSGNGVGFTAVNFWLFSPVITV